LTEFATAVFSAILAALLLFITGGAIGPIEALIIPTIGAALAAAWGAGKAAFDAYWITENFNIVLCAAYCNIGDDGSFTDAQFTAFWNKCNTDLPASPAKMLFMGFMSSSGATGLNVMAATGFSADADCSDCTCSDIIRVYVTPTGGTEVSWDGTTGILVADAEVGGPYGYILYIQLQSSGTVPDGTWPCAKLQLTIVSGSLVSGLTQGAYRCTETSQVNLTYGDFATTEVQQAAFVSNVPFQLSISAIP
jgi:hypothetical protein